MAALPDDNSQRVFGLSKRAFFETITCIVAIIWPVVLTAGGAGRDDHVSLSIKLPIAGATALLAGVMVAILIWRVRYPKSIDKRAHTLSITAISICLGIFCACSGTGTLLMFVFN